MNLKEFAEYVMRNIPSKREFKAGGFYNEEGLQIEYFHKDAEYYGEWLDHFLTVLRAFVGDEIVGCVIQFDKENPKYQETIRENMLYLDEFIVSKITKYTGGNLDIYKQVLEMVKDVKIQL